MMSVPPQMQKRTRRDVRDYYRFEKVPRECFLVGCTRSSRSQMFFKIGVLKSFTIQAWNLIRLQPRCFLIYRIPPVAALVLLFQLGKLLVPKLGSLLIERILRKQLFTASFQKLLTRITVTDCLWYWLIISNKLLLSVYNLQISIVTLQRHFLRQQVFCYFKT